MFEEKLHYSRFARSWFSSDPENAVIRFTEDGLSSPQERVLLENTLTSLGVRKSNVCSTEPHTVERQRFHEFFKPRFFCLLATRWRGIMVSGKAITKVAPRLIGHTNAGAVVSMSRNFCDCSLMVPLA